MQFDDKKRQLVQNCFQKNILVDPKFLSNLSEEGLDSVYSFISKNNKVKVLNEDFFKTLNKTKVNSKGNVEVLFCYDWESKKITEKDFISYFNVRYNAISRLLKNRPDMQNLLPISRIISKKEKEKISVIGIVMEKRVTKNNNIILTIEDNTGKLNVIITKSKKDVYNIAADVTEDEVIGIVGTNSDKIIFVDNIIYPDIPNDYELKKSPEEGYAVFISDIHIGLNKFVSDRFIHFIEWLNGRVGSEEQKRVAKKVKYLFIVGDLVEGVGIYPNQEYELSIKDIYNQYEECARLLSNVPPHISIIICPGNHDAMRIAEPQPPLYKDFAKPLYELENITLVSNPALIRIDRTENFEGIKVLMYHGFSFPYYADKVESIRVAGGMDRSDLIMKYLLQRRHMAPTHISNLSIPDPKKDPLVIDVVPDLFVSGHIHKISCSNYKNVTMINCSCWVTQTDFQAKMGIIPETARVPVVDLKTRKVKIIKF